MANRYWVGGTADWDGIAGTKWAEYSGGPGGASVPTSADNVFFDDNSGAGTVTIASGNTGAKSINCAGFTGTLTGNAAIAISGSVTLVAEMTVTYTGPLTLNGTGTLTSAGKTLGSVIINGVGITVTLGDALLLSPGILTVTQGTFTTSASNYSVTATGLSSSNSSTRTITLNGSTVTLTSNFPIDFTQNNNLTFNAGTSTILCSATSTIGLTGGAAANIGTTFYNVSFTGGTALSIAIGGTNTFNNLSVRGPASTGVRQVTFDSLTTINGTLSTTGTAGNRRVWFSGNTYGLTQTLIVNAAPNLTNADFRDIVVFGTAAPISGTRIGDRRGCQGITFSTPKTVYKVTATTNFGSDVWASTSGGTPDLVNFPLAQDIIIIDQLSNSQISLLPEFAIPTINASSRSNAYTVTAGSGNITMYGDFIASSAITWTGASTVTFSGRRTQTIVSAGTAFNSSIIIDSYGGTVELGDALSVGINSVTVTNGTFDTKNYNVTASSLVSSNSNVRTITLGSSTITLTSTSPVQFGISTNLVFNAGTSLINIGSSGSAQINGGSGVVFSNVVYVSTPANVQHTISGANSFNSLTINAISLQSGIVSCSIDANQTITGALTVAGATAVRRIFVRSDTIGTTRTLTVGTLSADNCDFRDITIAGAAAGSSPTRAGDCGGNSGITFPAPKTVYWNLAGAQNWSATAWAASSGGTPDINNFPLAQDTAVFDDTGSVTGTITSDTTWNIGTLDASARTIAMTIALGSSNSIYVHGNCTITNSVTISAANATLFFLGRSTSTITSNEGQFDCPISIYCVSGSVQLADSLTLTSTKTFTLNSGTFDAVTYNVTAGLISFSDQKNRTLKMGSGTWTVSGIGSVWNAAITTNLNFYKGTANIVLSDTSTSARTFAGGGLSYNKLTIGGTTGTSTLTITGNNQFTELASTKTVAHTIAFGSTTQTFGKWTVTGTSGNDVTLTGTGINHVLAGACTSGIDYLAMGSIGFSANSPGEFYAGANSTATAAVAPVYLTAKPADSTRYWVGGTGNWGDTARWSTSSGGANGASVPRSHDDVVFDAASNATAYTATVNAVTGGIRMKSLTVAGPASGNLTLAGSVSIIAHNNIIFPATGFTRTWTGSIILSGSTTGRTLTTNNMTHSASLSVNGVDCGWSLADPLNMTGATLIITNGSFSTAGNTLSVGNISSDVGNSRSINFGSSTVTSNGDSINFGTTETNRANLTFTAGTSQINFSASNPTLSGNNQTFYNFSFTSGAAGTVTLNGANSFNNLSFTGPGAAGLKNINLTADQTVTGTLTFSAGTNATTRHFVRSDTIGTTRTITAAAVSMTDVDFRDITIAGAAAPASGTRLGDCKGNSGITFGSGVNKYWNLAASGNWGGAIAWATSSGGTPDVNEFPLAQDTCIFEATGLNSGATVTVNSAYNIGTIDMSARTANTMTLVTGTQSPSIYGNWINGTGTTISGNGRITFAGRGSQTITSAGKTFTQPITIHSPGGSVTLLDSYTYNSGTTNNNPRLSAGTFNANGYNVTSAQTGTFVGFDASGSDERTLAMGSGTWTFAGGGAQFTISGSNITITGTGTISFISNSAKIFAGGGSAYTNITLNQGGAGTLTITGNNTFKSITNSYNTTGPTTINFSNTTQKIYKSDLLLTQPTNRLTLLGSPGNLIYLGEGLALDIDSFIISSVRFYPLTNSWYMGKNTNNVSSLGAIYDTTDLN